MPDSTQQLTIEGKARGFGDAARDVGQVTEATEKLQGQTRDTATETTKAAGAQKDLNAAESDYVSLLSQIDPVLGRIADGMVKGSKVAGDLATTEISLGDALDTVTTAMAANANTLKLLGAAGAAGLGFLAIAKAIGAVREESRKLQEQLAALKAEATTEEEERIAGAREVTRVARKRRERGFTPEEEAEAERLFGLAAGGAGFDQEQLALFQRNLAGLVGLIAGPQIETLTRAGVEVDLGAPAERRARAARRALERPEVTEVAEREEIRARAARARSAAEAMKELRAGELLEGFGHLNEVVEKVARGLDAEVVTDLARRIGELQQQAKALAEKWQGTASGEFFRGRADDPRILAELAAQQRAGVLGGMWRNLTGMEVGGTVVERQAAVRLVEALERNTEAMEAQQPTVVNQYHHARFVGPDAASQRARIRNGENEAIRLAG